MAQTDLISVRLIDDAGHTATTQLFVPVGMTELQIQALATAFMNVLDPVTGSQVSAATVTRALTVPGGLKAAALDDHFNAAGANVSFVCDGTPYRFTLRVPAWAHTLISDGNIDTGAAAFTNLINNVVNGVSPAFPSDRYGNDVDAFLAAELSFRKR